MNIKPKGVFIISLYVFISIVLIATIVAGLIGLPDEDAAILYSYSRNLAETGIISYNQGGVRAEGATDFGWMVLIAALHKLGISNHLSSAILNVFFVLLFGYRLQSLPKRLNLVIRKGNLAISMAAFIGIIYLSGGAISGIGGFSSIAQMSLLGIIFVSSLFRVHDVLFVLSGACYVLLRPDSIGYYTILVASFLLYRLVYDAQSKGAKFSGFSSQLRLALYALAFWRPASDGNPYVYLRKASIPILIFAAYWPLRAWYFSNPFPLPYYVKQSQAAGLGPMVSRLFSEFALNRYNAISTLIILALVALILTLVRVPKKSSNDSGFLVKGEFLVKDGEAMETNRPYLDTLSVNTPSFWLAGVVAWILFFVYQSLYLSRFILTQNIWDRFHTPLLGISAAFFASFLLVYADKISLLRSSDRSRRLILGLLLLIAIFVSVRLPRVVSGFAGYLNASSRNNMYQLSLDLARIHSTTGISNMLVTEAGKLSYYSRIPTVDAWGLNTPQYAVNPLQDPSDVAKLNPDIINLHTDLSRLSMNPVPVDLLLVGRDCEKSGDPPHFAYCGMYQLGQAMFQAATDLNYSLFLVPFHTDRTMPEARHDLFMVKPTSLAAQEIEQALLNNKAIPIDDPRELRNYYPWRL